MCADIRRLNAAISNTAHLKALEDADIQGAAANLLL